MPNSAETFGSAVGVHKSALPRLQSEGLCDANLGDYRSLSSMCHRESQPPFLACQIKIPSALLKVMLIELYIVQNNECIDGETARNVAGPRKKVRLMNHADMHFASIAPTLAGS
jgi:hypothetical protein